MVMARSKQQDKNGETEAINVMKGTTIRPHEEEKDDDEVEENEEKIMGPRDGSVKESHDGMKTIKLHDKISQRKT